MHPRTLSTFLALPALALCPGAAAAPSHTPTSKQILAESKPSEWRALDPQNTLYMQLPQGRVVIELAPQWAPAHVKNIKTLVGAHYFDGTSVYRVADNFVAQWGDPDGDNPDKAKSMGKARSTLPPEYTRSIGADFKYTPLADGDVYAPKVGFKDGLPMALDPNTHKAWLVQCYGMVGVARDVDPESGNGNTLYVPIGQAPRQIDHQLAVVGRVVQGMEWLSALPRGPEPLGVYGDAGKRTPIASIRLAADVPANQRSHLEVLRTDSHSFARLVEAKRNRVGDFYRQPAGAISICNAPLPVREVPAPPATPATAAPRG
ncbi:MAG TPA: peptidylprolyl isomerase [Rhodanobacteraceae bacterium]|nr:peptidylprolyl isomerase [Rhodanobacteraceae bacterium]